MEGVMPSKEKAKDGEAMENYFILMDLERTLTSYVPCFWKQNRFGYTYKYEQAGIFSKELAEEIVKNDLDNKTVMISVELVKQILVMDANEG